MVASSNLVLLIRSLQGAWATLRTQETPAGKSVMNISEILLQFFPRFALSPIVWVLFQKPQPHLLILPVDVLCHQHCIVPSPMLVLPFLLGLQVATRSGKI